MRLADDEEDGNSAGSKSVADGKPVASTATVVGSSVGAACECTVVAVMDGDDDEIEDELFDSSRGVVGFVFESDADVCSWASDSTGGKFASSFIGPS